MRRIKSATVKRLALCRRGKNGLATLFKADGSAEWALLVKEDAAVEGSLLAVAYPLGLADADGDIADTAEAIKSMAHSFMESGAQLDIEHDGKVLPRSAAFVSESFIIQKGDTRFHAWPQYDGKPVDVTGGWGVQIQINDPSLREARRNGEWDGVSLFGTAAVEQIDVKAASQRVAARLGGVQETTMTKEELAAALAAQKAELVEMLKSALAGLKPAEPKAAEQPKAVEAPMFTGDPLDPEALAAYETELRRHEMRKAIVAGTLTADQLAQMRANLGAVKPTMKDLVEAGIPAKDGDSAEVRGLQEKLFKAQKRSNAGPERKGEAETEADLLAKANHEEGMALGALINTHLGTANGMKVVSAR